MNSNRQPAAQRKINPQLPRPPSEICIKTTNRNSGTINSRPEATTSNQFDNELPGTRLVSLLRYCSWASSVTTQMRAIADDAALPYVGGTTFQSLAISMATRTSSANNPQRMILRNTPSRPNWASPGSGWVNRHPPRTTIAAAVTAITIEIGWAGGQTLATIKLSRYRSTVPIATRRTPDATSLNHLGEEKRRSSPRRLSWIGLPHSGQTPWTAKPRRLYPQPRQERFTASVDPSDAAGV